MIFHHAKRSIYLPQCLMEEEKDEEKKKDFSRSCMLSSGILISKCYGYCRTCGRAHDDVRAPDGMGGKGICLLTGLACPRVPRQRGYHFVLFAVLLALGIGLCYPFCLEMLSVVTLEESGIGQ